MRIEFEFGAGLDAAALETLWRDLEHRAPANFFRSWHWIGAWLTELKRLPAPPQPIVLVGRRQGRVVVLGLLFASNRWQLGPVSIPGARLHTTGAVGLDVVTIEYNGFLVDAACAREGEDAALDFLFREARIGGRRCDEIDLRNVSRQYAGYAASRGRLHRLVGREPSYRIDLDAVRAGGKPYLDTLSANTRQQIRRSMRLYEKLGPLTFRRAADLPEALQFLGGLKALHQPYWQGRGEPGAFAYPFLEDLMQRLIANELAGGGVELIRVSRADLAIGYLYNFVYRGQVYCYQCGFLFEPDARLKPGLVSHVLCIEDHLRTGAAIYDFMGGDARYKSSLGAPGPSLHYVLVQRATLPIRVEHGLRRALERLRAIRRTPGVAIQPPE